MRLSCDPLEGSREGCETVRVPKTEDKKIDVMRRGGLGVRVGAKVHDAVHVLDESNEGICSLWEANKTFAIFFCWSSAMSLPAMLSASHSRQKSALAGEDTP